MLIFGGRDPALAMHYYPSTTVTHIFHLQIYNIYRPESTAQKTCVDPKHFIYNVICHDRNSSAPKSAVQARSYRLLHAPPSASPHEFSHGMFQHHAQPSWHANRGSIWDYNSKSAGVISLWHHCQLHHQGGILWQWSWSLQEQWITGVITVTRQTGGSTSVISPSTESFIQDAPLTDGRPPAADSKPPDSTTFVAGPY